MLNLVHKQCCKDFLPEKSLDLKTKGMNKRENISFAQEKR